MATLLSKRLLIVWSTLLTLGTVRSHRKPRKITGIKMALTETRDQVGDIEQGDRHCGAMSTVPAKWLRNSRAVALGQCQKPIGTSGASTLSALIP
jgi:hypothetical protein